MRAKRIGALATLLATSLGGTGLASARVGQPMRAITYHGYSVTVPRSWPVYNLARAPHTCVRFNRHALYLGVPGAEQQCPANGVGRTEAILLEPARMAAAADGTRPALPLEGSATTFVVPGAGLRVTATWASAPRLIARALHRRTLPAASADASAARLAPRSSGGGTPAPAGAGVYTGPGFDVCDVPSTQQMSAWTAHSPYHALGVYIGGANAACPPSADPNLTPTWLSSEAVAGWHFVPTYVGLQAPNGCCQSMSSTPSKAATQGTAAADDAITQVQSLGLPSGIPIYDDMEYYSRTATSSPAVLAFLSAWTTELHAKGYLSGVYGNADSAIADLVTQVGTSYPEPDDIWFAAWPGDGSQSTNDPNIPATDWSDHQRLHQYSGGHNETYGGVTLNIDGDYLDGATAGVNTNVPPALSVSPTPSGVTNLTVSWNGLGVAKWKVLAGTSATVTTAVKSVPLGGARTTISVRSAAPYFAVEALGSTNQPLAASAPVAAPARLELFGRSSFVGEGSEVGTVPVGCYLAAPCEIVADVYSGRTRIARSAPQAFRVGGTGTIYYRLNWAGLRLLAKHHDAKLLAQVVVTDTSGASMSAKVSLIPFATAGRGPARSIASSPTIGAAGSTDFVHGWSGGLLVRCRTVSARWISATLSSGRTTIASARPQLIGGMELGYVYFALTRRGRQLLTQNHGNQFGAGLTLRSGTSTATARLSLVQF